MAKELKQWCIDNNRNDLLDEWDKKENLKEGKRLINDDPRIIWAIVSYNTPSFAHWKCKNGHKYICPIVARTKFGFNCPHCNPESWILPIGTKNGCLQITDIIEDANNRNYEVTCKCGKTYHFNYWDFIEKKHISCTPNILEFGESRCGLIIEREKKLQRNYPRIKANGYDIDLSHTFHDSLEILECVDEHYEELAPVMNRRKKDGGQYNVFKLYKCRCYLCGKEYKFKHTDFSISKTSKYSGNANSDAKCDCRIITTFMWNMNNVIKTHGLNYRVEVSFEDLLGVSEKEKLRFDVAVYDNDGSIKCLIECNGRHHYTPIYGKKQFEIQCEHDERKRNYCKQHNIKLIEISYKKKSYSEIKKILEKENIIT